MSTENKWNDEDMNKSYVAGQVNALKGKMEWKDWTAWLDGYSIKKQPYTPAQIEQQMDQAKLWLAVLGIDILLLNKMVILTFLALCSLKPDMKFWQATTTNMSLTKDIMKFVADNYNLVYKSNTRESFRRDGINLLLNHDIIDLNPGNPHLGPNSPHTHYAIKKRIINKLQKR